MSDRHPELPDDPDAQPRPVWRRPGLIAVVLAGGAAGTALRWSAGQAWPHGPGQWPTSTFTVNLVGALALGVLLEALARSGRARDRDPDAGGRVWLRLGLGTGFCGGLTTFSTLAAEIDALLREGAPGTAVGYGVASVLLGVLAAGAGIRLAMLVDRPGRSRT